MAKGRDKRKRSARKKPDQHTATGHPAPAIIICVDSDHPANADSDENVRVGGGSGSPIVDRIKLAFAGTGYPGDDAFPPRSIDEEPEKFRYLMGRRWPELELEKMPGLSDVLLWLPPEALQYYLPAFLVAAIRLQELPASRDVIGFLAPPGRNDPARSSFLYFAKGLTARVNLTGVFAYWADASD